MGFYVCVGPNHGLFRHLSVPSRDSWEHVGFMGRDREIGQEMGPSRVQTWKC